MYCLQFYTYYFKIITIFLPTKNILLCDVSWAYHLNTSFLMPPITSCEFNNNIVISQNKTVSKTALTACKLL